MTDFANSVLRYADAAFRSDDRHGTLPEKCRFLDRDTILCYPRATGDSRYPYAADGMTLWAYASGYLTLNESTFYAIPPADEGKAPYAAFFGGVPDGNGGYFPLSVTGTARQAQERGVRRCTVYTPQAVYYLTETDELTLALRAFVAPDKAALFSLIGINRTQSPRNIYLSAYLNCLLMHQPTENVETKWFKQCSATGSGFLFETVEDLDRTTHLENYGVLRRVFTGTLPYWVENTASRAVYAGGKTAALTCSRPLFTGHFARALPICRFSDTAAAGDLSHVTLGGDESAEVHYRLDIRHDRGASAHLPEFAAGDADRLIGLARAADARKYADPRMTAITFAGTDPIYGGDETFNCFIHTVMRQTEFAARAKNSGVSLLGVRDVLQQIEAALMWNPLDCRAKLMELIGFLDPSGRAPRQYSLPAPGAAPQMDTRAFIDQGLWLISAFYRYLAFTGDVALLEETAGYWRITGPNRVERTDLSDSVLDHLLRVADYLLAHLDRENTGCLRALYGDWNDALDGLGVSLDGSAEYGTGVSVMASLQLYRNLYELAEILDLSGGRADLAARFRAEAAALAENLEQYALVRNEKGERRILHGWGDRRAYTVGGFNDVDGVARDGLTANAYWVISGMYERDPSIKREILAAYGRLDGKYGLKTFAPCFHRGTEGVGRIVNLPEGTAENAATYVHATIFGVWSLFGMNESRAAWDQLAKILPLTHTLVTTTPFVMSNSYSYNPELGLDGDSMSDWFTGSANSLIKAIVWYVFGVQPTLTALIVRPAACFAARSAELRVAVRGCLLTIRYRDLGRGRRVFRIDGGEVIPTADPAAGDYLRLDAAALARERMTIEIED